MQLNSIRKPIQWLKDSWHLARPYWTSEDKWRAITLVSIVIVFNLLTVYMSVLFNKWNNSMYDSLQNFEAHKFYQLMIKFGFLAFFYILFQIVSYYFRKVLEIRWRRWMTNSYLSNWLSHKAYYKTRFIADYVDNPDQRISEDINSFIGTSLGLTLGFISNIVSLFSFVFILWGLSGALSFTVFAHKISIPGYMVWVALLYAIVGTYITFKIGRPLIKLNFRQETLEANFRFGLMRVREYGENIAFYQGEKEEKQSLTNKFSDLVGNFFSIVYRQMKIDIFNIGYSQIANIFPILVAAPRYFAKAIKLGDLMQISGAFGQVQGALSYFIDAYGSLASWRAIMDRLHGFEKAISDAGNLPVLARDNKPASYLSVNNLSLNLPNQESLLKNVNFELNAGDRLLIKGASGSGKTTLLRALAGLWPFASGEVSQNHTKTEMFIAQRPYMPQVSLRQAICYPLTTNLPDDADLLVIMRECGLAYLQSRLDEEVDWGKVLSLGEQQRVAFARILVNHPDIIYLDEASSALDEAMEAHLYHVLSERLPQSAIISVGHRSTLDAWHNQQITINLNRELNGSI
jgi:putative ATP-binding cassette transporter